MEAAQLAVQDAQRARDEEKSKLKAYRNQYKHSLDDQRVDNKRFVANHAMSDKEMALNRKNLEAYRLNRDEMEGFLPGIQKQNRKESPLANASRMIFGDQKGPTADAIERERRLQQMGFNKDTIRQSA